MHFSPCLPGSELQNNTLKHVENTLIKLYLQCTLHNAFQAGNSRTTLEITWSVVFFWNEQIFKRSAHMFSPEQNPESTKRHNWAPEPAQHPSGALNSTLKQHVEEHLMIYDLSGMFFQALLLFKCSKHIVTQEEHTFFLQHTYTMPSRQGTPEQYSEITRGKITSRSVVFLWKGYIFLFDAGFAMHFTPCLPGRELRIEWTNCHTF